MQASFLHSTAHTLYLSVFLSLCSTLFVSLIPFSLLLSTLIEEPWSMLSFFSLSLSLYASALAPFAKLLYFSFNLLSLSCFILLHEFVHAIIHPH